MPTNFYLRKASRGVYPLARSVKSFGSSSRGDKPLGSLEIEQNRSKAVQGWAKPTLRGRNLVGIDGLNYLRSINTVGLR
jgi:hypothetical protein